MASHGHTTSHGPENLTLGGFALRLPQIAGLVGIVGIVAALGLGFAFGGDAGGWRRFLFAYLIAFAYFLSIAVGALFFVLIQHVTHAGWSVNVRRLAEAIAAGAIPVLGVLSIPILLSVLMGNGSLYRWAWWVDGPASAHGQEIDAGTHGGPGTHQTPEAAAAGDAAPHAGAATSAGAEASADQAHVAKASAADEGEPGTPAHYTPDATGVHHHPSANGVPQPDDLTWHKRPYLNPIFFTLRVVFYFAVLGFVARLFWRRSVQQDADGDVEHTLRLQTWAAPALVAFALTVTFASFDLLMSLDPHWYSTMYGVYFFSGGVQSFFAVMIVMVYLLQNAGYLQHSITREHRHDLGKFLFAFTFFFGYIAFSQYMLLWYASIPETVMWLTYRGATTHGPDLHHYWAYAVVGIAIVAGCFAIPFAGLLSRHVKRHRVALLFWAIWILVFHFADVFWQVMPELDGGFHLGLPELAAMIGVGGVVTASVARTLAQASLRPVHDPRVEESLAFQNI